jgi:hypothetical protein
VKPLLVGELNPYGADPEMALYPLPENASGGRLQRILGLSRGEYLRRFDRVNLCTGKWDATVARMRALEIVRERDGQVVVLLGAKVAGAFLFDYTPFIRWGRSMDSRGPGVVYILPHPSGRNPQWNEAGAQEKARELLRDFLPRPELEHVTDGTPCWCMPETTPDGFVIHRRLQ